MKKYIIYSLNCPISNEIRYIGVTSTTIGARYSHHIYTGKYKHRRISIVSKWIYSLLIQNLKPVINTIEETDELNWEEREKHWIKYLKDLGVRLCNTHEGGKGVVRDRNKNGVQRSSEAKYKPIYQCDLDCTIIQEWDSAVTASEVTGISTASIYKCIGKSGNRNPTAGGYRWFHKEEYDNNTHTIKPYKEKHNQWKTVEELDLNRNVIREFKNIQEVADYTKLHNCRFYRKFSKGEEYLVNNKIYRLKKIDE